MPPDESDERMTFMARSAYAVARGGGMQLPHWEDVDESTRSLYVHMIRTGYWAGRNDGESKKE